MPLNYPGFAAIQPYDQNTNIGGRFRNSYDATKGIIDENKAAQTLADYAATLYGRPVSKPASLSALANSPLPQDRMIGGEHAAAAGATDPNLVAYFQNLAGAESGGDPNAKNPKSSATGLYQITDGTWTGLAKTHPELGLTPDGRTDPTQQEKAVKALTNDNIMALRQSGQPVNPATLYAAHFLGAGGASQVLGMPDETPMVSAVSPEVIQANPQLQGMTVGDFKQWAAQKGGGPSGGYQPPMAENANPGASVGQSGGLPPREVLQEMFRNPETRQMAIDLVKQAQTAASKGSDTKLGLNPQYGVDADGNPVLIQLGDNGQGVQTALPPGVKLSKEPIKIDAGTKWILLDPITRQPVGEIDKNTQQEAYLSGFGGAAGKAAAERIQALPGILAKSDNMLASIDGVLNDPALDSSTGWLSFMQAVPNTDQYRFGQRALQLQGQAFLQAFNDLRGGGAITQPEGEKATQAIGRLSTAQKPEDYRAALEELKGIIRASKARATSQAQSGMPSGGSPAPQGEKKVLTYNPATGELE